MVFCGIAKTEQIYLREPNNSEEVYFIELLRSSSEPKFTVWSEYDGSWDWEFWYTSETDYERVKWAIMDIAGDDIYNNIDETLGALEYAFHEYFSDMLVNNDTTHECCGKCSGHLN